MEILHKTFQAHHPNPHVLFLLRLFYDGNKSAPHTLQYYQDINYDSSGYCNSGKINKAIVMVSVWPDNPVTSIPQKQGELLDLVSAMWPC